MITLDKIERVAGFASNLPPCTPENYRLLADNLHTAINGWKHEMQAVSAMLGDKASAPAIYRKSALEILSGPRQTVRGIG